MPLTRSPSRRRDSLKQQQRRSRSPWRGAPEQRRGSERSMSPEYRTTCLSRPSRSPSPKQQPPTAVQQAATQPEPSYYGTTQLEQRSRSPSPTLKPVPQSLALQRLQMRFAAMSRFGAGGSGRRLPPVPGAGGHHSPPRPLVALSEYDQRSRSPSPCSSVYSLSSYYSHHRQQPQPPSQAQQFAARYGPVNAGASGPLVSSGAGSRIGHAIIAPFVMSLDQPILQHIRLPSVSNSPTRPDCLTQSPNDINFPRVCASPSHSTPPAAAAVLMQQQSQAQQASSQARLFA